MDSVTFLEFLAIAFGFYMAWNIGANDVANAMGTSVGSKALSLKKAVFLAAILEFFGAFFAGGSVSETIQKGIVQPEVFSANPQIFVLGMLGALLATGIALQVASYFGLPISTTHAIVGAVLGFGTVVGGAQAIHWPVVGKIVSSWILSPVLSGIISYFIFLIIQKKILFALNPALASRKVAPYFVFFSLFVLSMSFLSNSSASLSSLTLCLISLSMGLFAAGLSIRLLKKKEGEETLPREFQFEQVVSLEKALFHLQRVHLAHQSETHKKEISTILVQLKTLNDSVKKSVSFDQVSSYSGVEKTFVYLQILSACLVAFAHGSNDVANAIGPVAAVLEVLKTNVVSSKTSLPTWLLALGGVGIVFGLATWGWRVIETVGKKITELTPSRGFSAEFGASLTILLATKMGLPISTTHALVGSVFGVAIARGLRALNLQMLKEIVISWIVTLPFCAGLSILTFYLLKFFFI